MDLDKTASNEVQNHNITLQSKEKKTLSYTLSAKAPNDQINAFISVRFAGKYHQEMIKLKSDLENVLSFDLETKNLTFIKGKNITDRTINLAVKNSNTNAVKLSALVLIPPQGWNLSINLNEQHHAVKKGKIELNPGQNTLNYKLTGSGNAPVDAKENHDEIKISFSKEKTRAIIKLALLNKEDWLFKNFANVDLELIKKYTDAGADFNIQHGYKLKNLLHLATLNGRIEIAKALIEAFKKKHPKRQGGYKKIYKQRRRRRLYST